jgi:hypothetical protein
LTLGPVQLSLGHQVFIGYVDRTQLDAYVAWPFNFYQLTIGLAPSVFGGASR